MQICTHALILQSFLGPITELHMLQVLQQIGRQQVFFPLNLTNQPFETHHLLLCETLTQRKYNQCLRIVTSNHGPLNYVPSPTL